MFRSALALLVFPCLVPQASASLAPRRELPPASSKDLSGFLIKAFTAAPVQGTSTQGLRDEYTVTDQTEVILDGRPCRYKDVPPGASILRIELAPDEKTILRIHFRTRK
jgi:hypothetical protein